MSRPVQSLIVGVLVIVAAVASAGVVLALDDGGQTNQLGDQPDGTAHTITVSTSGEATARPDEAVVRLAVESTNADAAAARTAVAENVSSVRTALTELGIPEDAIRTSDYRIYEDNRPPKPTDDSAEPVYRARHVLTVDVDETDRVGAVIDTAVDAGATSVHDVRFTLSTATQRELENEALTDAMTTARSQADTLAESADVQIQGVANVQTGGGGVPRPYYAVQTAAAGGDAGTDIEAGPVTVTATVTVTYNASV